MPVHTPVQPALLVEQGVEIRGSAKEREKISLQGVRINPTQIAQLCTPLQEYLQDGKEPDPYVEHPLTTDERYRLFRNAISSVRGTLLQQLQYLSQITKRSSLLGRYPTFFDYQQTFPLRGDQFIHAMVSVQDLTLQQGLESGNVSQALWNTWRMMYQDFTPKGHTNYTIPPHEIQSMWEDGAVSLEDLSTFHTNFKDTRFKLDPRNTLLVNEIPLITNLLFPEGNIQVFTSIDEICIPCDFPRRKILVIDYKTGKQFKNPGPKEKIQIFLMLTAVLTNIIDRVPRIRWGDIQWDTFPSLMEDSKKDKLISCVFPYDLINLVDIYDKLDFRYVDPLTQKSISVTSKDIGIDTPEGIKTMLGLIETIARFYSSHKHILKPRLEASKSQYILPIFPSRQWDNTSGVGNQRYIQGSLHL